MANVPRLYLGLVERMLTVGTYTKEEIIDAIMRAFPNLNRDTVYTGMSDLLNPKYTWFPDRDIVINERGQMSFVK